MGPLHTLLITRILKVISTGLWVPLLLSSPRHSLQASFVSRLNVSHSEFLDVGEQILYGCSWITVKNCQGKYDQVDSFSDIHFLFFWSSVSYLWHLSTFLCFPWVSFSVKWRDWVRCFQTVLPSAFWRLGWAQWKGAGDSEQCWLPEGGGSSSLRLQVNQGLRVKRSENHEAASLLTRQCRGHRPCFSVSTPFPEYHSRVFSPQHSSECSVE